MKFQATSLSIQEVEGVETLKFHLGTMKTCKAPWQRSAKNLKLRAFYHALTRGSVPLKPTGGNFNCCRYASTDMSDMSVC